MSQKNNLLVGSTPPRRVYVRPLSGEVVCEIVVGSGQFDSDEMAQMVAKINAGDFLAVELTPAISLDVYTTDCQRLDQEARLAMADLPRSARTIQHVLFTPERAALVEGCLRLENTTVQMPGTSRPVIAVSGLRVKMNPKGYITFP